VLLLLLLLLLLLVLLFVLTAPATVEDDVGEVAVAVCGKLEVEAALLLVGLECAQDEDA